MRPALLACVPLLAAVGCGDGSAPPLSTLAAPAAIATHGAVASDSALAFTIAGGARDASSTVQVAVTGLSLDFRNDSPHPELTALTVPLADLDVARDDMPPAGLALRELAIALREPARMTLGAADPDHLTATGTALFELRWAMRLPDGSMYALGPAVMEPMPVTIDAVRDATGDVRASIDAACDGDCWRLEGVALVRDATLHAAAPATVTALP